MSIKSKCTKYLLEAVLAVAPVAMMCGAVGVRPESKELKAAQDAVENVGKLIGQAQKDKTSIEAKLITPARSTSIMTR